ncbi:unnamed protein product [Schistosoma rodhaini]|uniref:Uncharacterized protein n=1 Tax=Schistosoma rodhaini TaxID=6188 RepID=A0AA85EJI0_9TREM|nr:unnamed protein product [Schistosoma rodhaini]
MESVAAHKDEVTHVESKIEELKRKSVDLKDVADHEAKNGNDEPVVKKIRKEAGDTDGDEKAHSPESRSAEAELDEDGTEGKLVYSLKYVPYTFNTHNDFRLIYIS